MPHIKWLSFHQPGSTILVGHTKILCIIFPRFFYFWLLTSFVKNGLPRHPRVIESEMKLVNSGLCFHIADDVAVHGLTMSHPQRWGLGRGWFHWGMHYSIKFALVICRTILTGTMQISSRPVEIIIHFWTWKRSGDLCGWWVWLVRIKLHTRVTIRVSFTVC